LADSESDDHVEVYEDKRTCFPTSEAIALQNDQGMNTSMIPPIDGLSGQRKSQMGINAIIIAPKKKVPLQMMIPVNLNERS
jgi:hypothetical protein